MKNTKHLKNTKLVIMATAGILVLSSCGKFVPTMEIDKTDTEIKFGETSEKIATLSIDEKQKYDFTVKSSDESIATVSVKEKEVIETTETEETTEETAKPKDEKLTETIVVTGIAQGETTVTITATVKNDENLVATNSNVVYASENSSPTADVDGTTNENGQQTRSIDEPMEIDGSSVETEELDKDTVILTETINVKILDNPELTAKLEAERIEAERVQAEKAEAERVANEKAEAERVQAEKVAAEKAATEKATSQANSNTNNSNNSSKKPSSNSGSNTVVKPPVSGGNVATPPPTTPTAPPSQGGWTLTQAEVNTMIANAKAYGISKGLTWEPSAESYGGSGTKDTNKISNTYKKPKSYLEETLKGSIDSYIKGYNTTGFYISSTSQGNGHYTLIVKY